MKSYSLDTVKNVSYTVGIICEE